MLGWMKKRDFVLYACLTLLIITVSSSSADDVDKAKEYIQTGMHTKAIILLESIVNDKRADAEAHFQLGICYIKQNNFIEADEQFKSAVKLNSDYGYKIGQRYEKIGTTYLNNDQVSRSVRFFNIAVKYQPNLKENITEECFQKGKIYLNKHNTTLADDLFSMCRSYNPSLNEKIKSIEVAYGKKLLEIAKEKPIELRKRYINKASGYLSKKEIEEVFPPSALKTVFKKEYIGKGFAVSDAFETAEFGKDISYGDKIIVTGKNFEIWVGGRTRWKKISSRYEVICKTIVKGKSLGVKAPKGEKIIVEIQR